MDNERLLLKKYVDAAADLAESVKRNIVHGNVVDNETILKLNAFTIASNAVQDMTKILEINEDGETLN